MSENLSPATNVKIVEFFQRHLVPIYFSFRKNDQVRNCVITTFALDVSGYWYLITAGHVLQDIEKLIDAGFEVRRCRLIDTLAQDAPHKDPLPFDYSIESTVHFDPDIGLDFGVIQLDEIVRQGIEKNGVVPFIENTWQEPSGLADSYMMLGIPEELSNVTETVADIPSMIHRVVPLEQKPARFPEVIPSMFYGRVILNRSVSSIKGMSGGPILALREIDGQLKYWLHAVQSSWFPDTREISACRIRLLAEILKESIEEAEAKLGVQLE